VRFLPHCLFVLLAAAPALAHAQLSLTTPSVRVRESSGAPAQAAVPPVREGSGCGSRAYTGYVKSGENPLVGASVSVLGTKLVLVTNGLGFFVLPPSVQTWPTLAVDAMGYEPVTITYQDCEPLNVNLNVLPGTRFKKHGRKKGFITPPKSHP
jgi:hypothetical protein